MAQGFTREEQEQLEDLIHKILSAAQIPNWMEQKNAAIRVVTPDSIPLSTTVSGGSTTSAQDQMFRDLVNNNIAYSQWHHSFQ